MPTRRPAERVTSMSYAQKRSGSAGSFRDAPARKSFSNFVNSAASGAVWANAVEASNNKITPDASVFINTFLLSYDSSMSIQIEMFRELHASGCFVLPNPWDPGSAVYLRHLGFKALATTSSGYAFSRGMPDNIRYVRRDVVLNHFREIVNATPLPVNGDFQNGHADEPEGIAENVTLCVATGVAGLSIEDSTGDPRNPLYDFELAIERVKAARRAIDESGLPVLLTARCEAWLVEESDPF